jgi:hypothetical protein
MTDKSLGSPLAKALERGFRGEVSVKHNPPPLNAVIPQTYSFFYFRTKVH